MLNQKTKITKELLESGGIYDSSTPFKKDRYWCDVTNSYLKIYSSDTLKDILEIIYHEGVEAGKHEGKRDKINEIKKVLDLE